MEERSDILNLYKTRTIRWNHAWDIPSPWYFDQAIARLEQDNVFATTCRCGGAESGAAKKGEFSRRHFGGEPIVVARGGRWHDSRVLQRLPASCRRGGHRSAGLREAVPLPVSRLDLRHRRRTEGMSSLKRLRFRPRAKNGLVPGEGGYLEKLRLRDLDGKALPLKDFSRRNSGIVAPLQLRKKMKFSNPASTR